MAVQEKAKTVIIIAGPTAVGKTAVGIDIARHFGTEIISADSRQCFKELNIGVARPSAAELSQVPHHFIASHFIHQKVTAATFEAFALQKAEELFEAHDTVVMVGGTGLYIKAFCDGMDEIPEVPLSIHQEVVHGYSENGMEWLQGEIERLDPEYWGRGETRNPQRMMRALEVAKSTGRSILHFQSGQKKQRGFSVIKIALDIPRQELHNNINHRVDRMMQMGLVEEVKSLLPFQQLNALQTVGYKELFAYLNGGSTLQNAVESIKANTRQYAKRQLTWFRKDQAYTWHLPNANNVIHFLEKELEQKFQ